MEHLTRKSCRLQKAQAGTASLRRPIFQALCAKNNEHERV